ncbi:unnamed protein product [Arabis nemorensis]|uniref:Uncharacterized protein n=1 Tax=Arabis nemorensis TaxID=586526 RepID=A0A565BQZ7_9BRAS|nr:unnamed protein product [Arabis nemorensis]
MVEFGVPADMSDALSVIPAAVHRDLSDELYVKRKNSALDGGLIGLAAVTIGLSSDAAQQYLEIAEFGYYACEALYNIAKAVRREFLIFFNQTFDALCKLSADSDADVQSAARHLDRLVKFSIEEFIPLLKERMNVLNPYVREFLVGWYTVLGSLSDIDMREFLPDFLDEYPRLDDQ